MGAGGYRQTMEAQPFASLAAPASVAGAERHLLDFNLSGVGLAVAFRAPFMSRIERESPAETPGAQFRRILAEVRQARGGFEDVDEDDIETSNFSANPFANAIFSFEERPATPGGGSSWDAALAWVEELDGPAAIVEARQPGADTAEAILDELGLNENLTYEELNQARRLYMWRNHPDRLGEAQRESATRRVAIANMLVDRAQARLISNRRT
jgi:hypothetical protein